MRAIALALLLACSVPAHAAGHEGHVHGSHGQGSHDASWTTLPLIESVPGRDRGEAGFRLDNIATDNVHVFAPGRKAPLPEGLHFRMDRTEWSIPVEGQRVKLQSAGVGNYHWLSARQETPQAVTVASTAYYFSNPGPAPTAMLARSKSELEISPDPLPREHNRYRVNQAWRFAVRFQDKPLAGVPVVFESSGGTRTSFVSDANGQVLVRFPADVKPAAMGGTHGMVPSNRFVLAVEHQDQGRHYLTAFNFSYGEDAYAGKSVAWGAGFLALGGAVGLPLIVRRREKHNG